MLSSREREERNYNSITLQRQELNICSEASCNIIQVRGDSAVICYPCVPSGSEEGRQTTYSYHSSVLIIILRALNMAEGNVRGINSSFIILDNFCIYRISRTGRGTETLVCLLNLNP